jgi:RimJ/RimL family protein N-acetyltransferase
MNVIESKRLTLRELELQDAEFILGLLNQDSFIRQIGDKGVRTLDDAREYILKGPIESYQRFAFGLYLTSLRHCGTPIGICGLVKRDGLDDVDVGFAILPQFWRQGYAAEAAAAVLDYGRRVLRLQRIVAITTPANHASIAVLERIGFRFERMIKLSEQGTLLKLFGPADGTD